jgi:hypothetical protein
MTAPVYNITIDQGADFVLPLTYLNPNQTPVNITGWSAEMMVRQTYSDNTPLVSLSSQSNGITLGGTAGTITIDIPASQTEVLPPGVACYDIKLFDIYGDIQRLIQGSVTISAAVTR